jgi:hypothetical protein
MEVRKPIWTTASVLVYAGGLTVLGSAIAALAYLSEEYGPGAFVAWTLLPLAVLYAVALAFRRRGQWVAAGLFAAATVAMWSAFVGSLFDWWGWFPDDENNPLQGAHWSIWLLLLLVMTAAAIARRAFRFPLLLVFTIGALSFLVVDVVSGGGSWSAVVTLLLGLLYLLVGKIVDGGAKRPYAFWWHLAAGLAIGTSLVYWWHESDTDWALLAVAGLVYLGVGARTRRSTWTVLGIGGFAASAAHWSDEWSSNGFSVFSPGQGWVPSLVFAVVGFLFVAIGLKSARRRQDAMAVSAQAESARG